MSKRFTRAEAEALATYLSEQYEFVTLVSDVPSNKEMALEAFSFVGIHLNSRCIVTFDSFSVWQDLKKIAYTIVSDDAYMTLQKHLEEDHLEEKLRPFETKDERDAWTKGHNDLG